MVVRCKLLFQIEQFNASITEGAGEADRSFRQSQVDAAVRFCAKVFGKDYAALLSKAAEVAATPDRKAAQSG